MHKRSKLMLAGLTAAFLLSLAVGAASASRLRVSEQKSRIVWQPLTFNAGGLAIRCNVTLEGTFHSATISKVERALVGFINAGTVQNETCTGGHATINKETLPWHRQYGGFTGTLPAIEKAVELLVGASYKVQPNFFLACKSKTTATSPARGIINLGASGEANSVKADETVQIPLESPCEWAGEGGFAGTSSSVKGVGNATVVSVKLI
jgi:hypothetical protein